MNRQPATRNLMVEWQVAPPGKEAKSRDEHKFKYRRYVDEMIHAIPEKSARNTTFTTISTNVLGAEIDSSILVNKDLTPIYSDIYLPLEIGLAKWSTSDAGKEKEERRVELRSWIIDPGKPSSNNDTKYHQEKYKTVYDRISSRKADTEKDLEKIVKEINAFLTPDRVVFSHSLRHCRQDLGCLKWLNRQTGGMKPIKVYSAEDLYVVLLRYLCFESDQPNDYICQGVARLRFGTSTNLYDLAGQCEYHQALPKEDESSECGNCAKAIAVGWCHVILDDLFLVMQDPEADEPAEAPDNNTRGEPRGNDQDRATDDISARMGAISIGKVGDSGDTT